MSYRRTWTRCWCGEGVDIQTALEHSRQTVSVFLDRLVHYEHARKLAATCKMQESHEGANSSNYNYRLE